MRTVSGSTQPGRQRGASQGSRGPGGVSSADEASSSTRPGSAMQTLSRVLAYQARVREQRKGLRTILQAVLATFSPNHAEPFAHTSLAELIRAKLMEEEQEGQTTSGSSTPLTAAAQLPASPSLARMSPSLSALGSSQALNTSSNQAMMSLAQQLEQTPFNLSDSSTAWPSKGAAYKKRLRLKELGDMARLQQLAVYGLNFAPQGGIRGQRRGSLNTNPAPVDPDRQAWEVLRGVFLRNRGRWELLLAAERRLDGSTQGTSTGVEDGVLRRWLMSI